MIQLNAVNDFESFTSPSWPNHYPNYAYQEFIIHSPVGTVVKLDVLDLELEDGCLFDTVTIYNGKYLLDLHSFLIFNDNSI